MSDFQRIRLDIADYPARLKPKIDQTLSELSPEHQPQLWLRAFLAKLFVTEDNKTIPQIEAKLHFAIALAERGPFFDELIDLKDSLLWFEVHSENKNLDFAAISSRSEAIFKEAGDHKLLTKKAMLMASFASYVRETGDSSTALNLLHEANGILSQAPDATDLDRLNMKNNM